MSGLPDWARRELCSLLPSERLDSPRQAERLEDVRRKVERLQADVLPEGAAPSRPPDSLN